MYFLFSGEGPSDLGTCFEGSGECEGEAYNHGPMTIFVDHIVEELYGYSLLEAEQYGYVSENRLSVRATDELKPIKKAIRIPGKRQPREIRFFFNNARMLARIALEKQHQLDDEVVAILFHDSDGTAWADRQLWNDKRRSIIDGFAEEGYPRGVPMVPKPKSEAWIICAVKVNPYQACPTLEDRSGNDNSPNSLKNELEGILGGPATRETLNPMVADRTINVRQIDMPSLRAFRDRLQEVI